MPRCGKPAEITAAPQPPKTSKNVPKNSASSLRPRPYSIENVPSFWRPEVSGTSMTGSICRIAGHDPVVPTAELFGFHDILDSDEDRPLLARQRTRFRKGLKVCDRVRASRAPRKNPHTLVCHDDVAASQGRVPHQGVARVDGFGRPAAPGAKLSALHGPALPCGSDASHGRGFNGL